MSLKPNSCKLWGASGVNPLGPLLFNLYMYPLGQLGQLIMCRTTTTQMTLSSVSLTAGQREPVYSLCHCIEQITVKIQNNFLQLSLDKGESLVH